MSADRQKPMVFGDVAESYDRIRPGPASAALDWLVPDGCAVAVDLAAGTGLFTRALLSRVPRVVAVEPDPRMLAVLSRRSPGVDARVGRAEAIPLPDASADALFVSTAWHWLDLPLALHEIHRVLRPGGRLGIIWTSRDRDVDWVAELDLILPVDPPRTITEARDQLARHHAVDLPEGIAFGPHETTSFGFARTLPADAVVEWLTTDGAFITASPAAQATALTRWGEVLAARSRPAPDGAAPVIDLPSRSWCWRARSR